MIVVLSCSINSLSKSITSSTGRIEQDSVTIAISDIRKANAKLIELSYEKILIRIFDKLLKMIVYLQNKLDKDIYYWIGHISK